MTRSTESQTGSTYPMPFHKKFLVVDDNADGRSLLARTLLRKFPHSLTIECAEADSATRTAVAEKVDAIIVHRAREMEGIELIPLLHEISPGTPIIYVTGADRSQAALAGGATACLSYDAWLRVGTVVAEALDPQPWPAPPTQAEVV
jgi:DNA-binding NtrC family response regulator